MPLIKIMSIYKRIDDRQKHARYMQSLGLKHAFYKNEIETVNDATLTNLKQAQAACQLCFIIKGDNNQSAIVNDHKGQTSYSAKYKLQNL